MTGNGIMAEIRTLLAQGRSSGEVIALGYKPPTVYKVQRQLHQKGQGSSSVAAPRNAQLPVTTGPKPWSESESEVEAEIVRLRQEVETLESHLEEVFGEEIELEDKVKTLEERVKALESEEAASGQLREAVNELASEIEFAANAQATMRQNLLQWQRQAEAEQAARLEAERKLHVAEHKYDHCLIITP